MGRAEVDQLGALTENERDDALVATALALLGIENLRDTRLPGPFFAVDPAAKMRACKTVLPSGHNAVLFSPDFLEALRTVCCFAPGFIYKLQVGTAGRSDPVVRAFLLAVGRFWIPELPRQTAESLLLHSLPEQLWPDVQHFFLGAFAYLIGHELSHAEHADAYGERSRNRLVEARADRDGLAMFSRYVGRNAGALGPSLKRVCVAPYLVLCLLALKSDADEADGSHPSVADRLAALNDGIGSSLGLTLGAHLGAALGGEAVAEVRLVGTALVALFSEFRKELDDLARKAMCHDKAFPRHYEVEGQAPGALLRSAIGKAQIEALPEEQRRTLEGMLAQYAAAEEAEAAADRAS